MAVIFLHMHLVLVILHGAFFFDLQKMASAK